MKTPLSLTLFFTLSLIHCSATQTETEITEGHIRMASELFGLNFTQEEINQMLQGDIWDYHDYESIRQQKLDNSVPMALQFNPLPYGFSIRAEEDLLLAAPPSQTRRPANLEDAAFYSVRDLAHLLKTRQVTSTELTKMYLSRLKRHGGTLECVIALTEDLALKQAAKADEEIAAGAYRGLLHGIPYGAKDLLAAEPYPTTWGAKPYQDQVIHETATVIQRLEEAGAVLTAKLTLGALAMGDYWFGGQTRNPWNLEQGSSGSSAGSASATSAGLVAFSIGTETNGSIVSPSIRCGATGLRPTFGRVSRAGAMALSWSMDKIGPICRDAQDCAIVLRAICGADGIDQTVIDAPLRFQADMDLSSMKIGYLKQDIEDDQNKNKEFDLRTVQTLQDLGAEMVPVELPDMDYSPLFVILSAEAAAAFDQLTLSGLDDQLTQQTRHAWPNAFRKARLIPAVEYIQANRIRTRLIEETHGIMQTVDAILAPPFNSDSLLLTNLTGHPCVVFPNGFKDDGTPAGTTLIGGLFEEGKIASIIHAYQRKTNFHNQQPKIE